MSSDKQCYRCCFLKRRRRKNKSGGEKTKGGGEKTKGGGEKQKAAENKKRRRRKTKGGGEQKTAAEKKNVAGKKKDGGENKRTAEKKRRRRRENKGTAEEKKGGRRRKKRTDRSDPPRKIQISSQQQDISETELSNWARNRSSQTLLTLRLTRASQHTLSPSSCTRDSNSHEQDSKLSHLYLCC